MQEYSVYRSEEPSFKLSTYKHFMHMLFKSVFVNKYHLVLVALLQQPVCYTEKVLITNW